MQLEINGPVERAILSVLHAGDFDTVEHVLAEIFVAGRPVRLPIGQPPDAYVPPVDHESHDQWRARFDAFIARQRPTGHDVDDSRDAIYGDHP